MAKTAGSQIKQKPKTNNKSCSQKNTYIYIYTYTANGMSPNKEYIFIYNRPTKVSFFFKLFFGQRSGGKWKKWAPHWKWWGEIKTRKIKGKKKAHKRSNIFHLVTNFRSRYFGFSLSSAISAAIPSSVFRLCYAMFSRKPRKKNKRKEMSDTHPVTLIFSP